MKYIILSILIFLILSCDNDNQELRFSTGSEGGTYIYVGEKIKKLIEEKTNLTLHIEDGENCNSNNNLEKLLKNESDLVLAQNDVPIKEIFRKHSEYNTSISIKTVLPLYDEICFVIYKDIFNPQSFSDLLKGKRVCISKENSGTEKFAYELFKAFGVDTSEFDIINTDSRFNYICDSIDVSISLTGFNNPRIHNMLLKQNGKIFSLDHYEFMLQGSSVEGVCLNNSLWQPYLIPKNTYKYMPKFPVLTISVKSVLLASDKIDENIIYDLVETLIINNSILSNDVKILNNLSENIKLTNLNFPLHPGTRLFLERNAPSFFERYAEVIGVIFTIIVAFIGGVKSVVTWNKFNKKNRIDRYYKDLIDTQEIFMELNSEGQITEEIHKLVKLRKKAFEELIKEKLIANESFQIFTELLENTIRDMERKRQYISNKL